MDPPKWYGPTSGLPPNLLPKDSQIQGTLLTIAIKQEKQQNNMFKIEWIKYYQIEVKVVK